MIKKILINRLKEASTWKAILAALSTLGLITFTDAQSEAVVAAAVAVYAALSLVLPDKFGKEGKE